MPSRRGNKITLQLRKLILQQPSNKAAKALVRSHVSSPEVDHSMPATKVRSAAAPSDPAMAGRFSIRSITVPEPVPASEPSVAADAGPSTLAEPAPQPTAVDWLLTDKLLDAKVRLHRRLIEETNLSALEKLPAEEIRSHVQQLVSQYVLTEQLALNAQELKDFVSEILDEMLGLGPLEPLLKDQTH